MNNPLELKPNIIIGDRYEGFLILDAWKGFQSRQGPYDSRDKIETASGQAKVTIEGIPIDYVKVCSQAQVAAIHYLVEYSESIQEALLKGLLHKFPAWKDIYEDDLPNVSDIGQFKDLIGLSYLHVMSAERDGYAYIGFELGCAWDEEHGAGVLMHKERVIDIGQADTSFNSWTAFEDNGTKEIQQEKRKPRFDRIFVLKKEPKLKIKPWWKFW